VARIGDEIEVWGDDEQTRSFLYIDECVEGTVRLLRSNFPGPINIGSAEMITINQLVDLVAEMVNGSERGIFPDRKGCAGATQIIDSPGNSYIGSPPNPCVPDWD
jgi:nucleoside-diphosphate-sugar epimerase